MLKYTVKIQWKGLPRGNIHEKYRFKFQFREDFPLHPQLKRNLAAISFIPITGWSRIIFIFLGKRRSRADNTGHVLAWKAEWSKISAVSLLIFFSFVETVRTASRWSNGIEKERFGGPGAITQLPGESLRARWSQKKKEKKVGQENNWNLWCADPDRILVPPRVHLYSTGSLESLLPLPSFVDRLYVYLSPSSLPFFP